jgi:hypothetical protein
MTALPSHGTVQREGDHSWSPCYGWQDRLTYNGAPNENIVCIFSPS